MARIPGKMEHYFLQVLFFLTALTASFLLIKTILCELNLYSSYTYSILFFAAYGLMFLYTKNIYPKQRLIWRYILILVAICIAAVCFFLLLFR